MKLLSMTLCHAGAAHLLEEAIESVPFADSHLVVDTSPDKPDVKKVAKKLGSKIVLHSWAWRSDFSAARNEVLRIATTLAEDDTYAVLIDSDERMVCSDPASLRQELTDRRIDAWFAWDVSGGYSKERVFRLPTKAKYWGPTHEACFPGGATENLKSLKFWETGKTHEAVAEKFRRDEVMLKKHTKQNPSDPRWWYYLGQTQEAIGKTQEAIDSWIKCAKLRGWDEEGAWACYRAAENLIKKNKYQEAIEVCARGLTRHSGVAELCWLAAVASIRAGLTDKGIYWAKMAVALGDYQGANLSSKRSGFRYTPALYELPYDILRFSLPTPEGRQQAEIEFWLAKFKRYGGTPEECSIRRDHNDARHEARNDIGRWAKTLVELAPSVKVYPIENPSSTGYHCMNPSVCMHDSKLVAVVRTVNYTIDDKGFYIIPPGDQNVVKTENYLADVSPKDYTLSNIRPILDKTGGKRFTSQVVGYEDMRLVSFKGKLYASATTREHRPGMPCDIVVCELNAKGHVVREWLQPSTQQEKNWMPFVDEGHIQFVYSVDPTVVRRFDSKTGLTKEVARSTPGLALDHLRGGAQIVPFANGWLAVTHEVVVLDDRRRYLHRFVRLDSNLRVTHVSPAWRLRTSLGIEFAAGMTIWKNKIVLSIGLDDREACFVTLDPKDVMRVASEIVSSQ